MRLHWWSFPNDTTKDKFVNLMPLEVRQTPTLCSWSSPSSLKGVPVPTRASQLHQSWFQPRGNDSKGLFCIWASVWLLHCKDFLLPVQMPFRREQSHNSIGYQLILNQAQRHTQLPFPHTCSTVTSMEKPASPTPSWITYSRDETAITNTQASENYWKCYHLEWL